MRMTPTLFEELVSLEHLFQGWTHFRRGKRKRKDIQYFERYLEDRIFQIQADLNSLQYQHGPYEQFYVTDPKQRCISKACVRDRLVHEVVYQLLSPVFDHIFIFHSLSSRVGKGTHFGIEHLKRMTRKVSKNGKFPCFALKMDIKRFFDTVDHRILKTLIRKRVREEPFLVIIDRIIDSFFFLEGCGIPLGNVTSQLFANIYLHELDDFIKQGLREKYYLRYCDDFVILSRDKAHLQSLIAPIGKFLGTHLHLELHPKKVTIRKLTQGIDFVGYLIFPKHSLVRTRTKQRMKKRLLEASNAYVKGKISDSTMDRKLNSYLGVLSHANQHDLSQALRNAYWVRS